MHCLGRDASPTRPGYQIAFDRLNVDRSARRMGRHIAFNFANLYVASRGLDFDDAFAARHLDVPAGSVTVDRALNLSQFQIAARCSHLNFTVQVVHSDVSCLLYTSDAADERSSVDLGGR